MEKSRYYDKGQGYAQGWSMVYFLRTSKDVQKRPQWASILPTYFDTLKAAYAEELAKLTPDAAADPAKKTAAGARARERAVTAAFNGVDLGEIESAWKAFLLAEGDKRSR